jgi:hypothetical protein
VIPRVIPREQRSARATAWLEEEITDATARGRRRARTQRRGARRWEATSAILGTREDAAARIVVYPSMEARREGQIGVGRLRSREPSKLGSRGEVGASVDGRTVHRWCCGRLHYPLKSSRDLIMTLIQAPYEVHELHDLMICSVLVL